MSKPVLNRHQRRRQRTQRQLEQATSELLIKHGFEALTIQDIAEQADLGRGTFYLHFQDKEEAVWSLTERVLHEGDTLSELANAKPAMPADLMMNHLVNGIAGFFAYIRQHRDLFLVLLGERGSPNVSNRIHAWLYTCLEPLILTDMPYRSHPDLPGEIAGRMMTGACVRLLHWWLEQENPAFSPDTMARMALIPFFNLDMKNQPN